MHKETEFKILQNSRMIIANTHYVPIMVGAIAISTIYLVSGTTNLDLFFAWLWIGLGIFSFLRRRKMIKHIVRSKE